MYMSTINFQPIFDYIDESHDRLKQELKSEIKTEFHQELGGLKTAIANIAAQLQTNLAEQKVAGHRLNRLEDWAGPVGEKVGLPISW